MDVVLAGTALYVSPSNAVQLSPSSLSIGTVLITRPDVPLAVGASAPDLSLGQGSSNQALAAKLQGSQQAHSSAPREASAQILVSSEVVKSVGLTKRIDVYL